MSTLYIDEEKIEERIIPRIQSAINKLNSAINIGKLNVPSDFEFYNYLSQLHNKNYNSRQSLIIKRNQIDDFIKKYKLLESQNLDDFSNIKILDVLPRDTLNK